MSNEIFNVFEKFESFFFDICVRNTKPSSCSLKSAHRIYPSADRHKTFKLRLPTIRRNRQKLADGKQAAPTAAGGGGGGGDGESRASSEESVPLQQFSPFVERLRPSRLASGLYNQHERPVDHDLSDLANWPDSRYPAWKSSQDSLRKASSLEDVEGKKSPAVNRLESAPQSSGATARCLRYFNGVEGSWEAVCSLVRSCVRSSVRPSRNVRLRTANKRLELSAPIFAQVCMLSRYVRSPIFIQIHNVLDFHFQGQRFEPNALASAKCVRGLRPIGKYTIAYTVLYNIFAIGMAAADT